MSIQRGENGAVLTKRKRSASQRVEIVDQDVAALEAELQAIGENPDKFKAFINAVESGHFASPSAIEGTAK